MKKKIKSLQDWNREQVHQSESYANRVSFHQLYRRHGTPSELIQHYIDNGGARFFAKTHERDYAEEDDG